MRRGVHLVVALLPQTTEGQWFERACAVRQSCPDESDWECLTRGGPDGLFKVLKMLSFWLLLRWYDEDFSAYYEVLCDAHWVLGEVLKQTNGGSDTGRHGRRTAHRNRS